jgi:hypothetical protein
MGDPLARQELVAWLKELRAEYGEGPQFVATEWDSGAKSKGLRDLERARFRNFGLGLWGDACDSLIAERLSLMVGWEVDAHREVFPNLDPGGVGGWSGAVASPAAPHRTGLEVCPHPALRRCSYDRCC